VAGKQAVKLSRDDYHQYDYIIGMEARNITNMIKIFGSDPESKVKRLLDYGTRPRDIADPWYTGDFDTTYEDVLEGCEALLEHINKKELDCKSGN
jgi:protein-tyrosine phosphatase